MKPPADVTATAPAPAPPLGAGTPAADRAAQAAELPLNVVLAPTAPCWVSVRVDGRRVPGRLLQGGERLELSAASEIVLTAGDAGALAYTVNKAGGRPLGPAGQTVTVVITPSNAQTFVAR